MTSFAGNGTSAIGPFRIIRLLGEGGMGQVYLAASASGRQVAVKVVRPELAGDASFRRRFRAEVKAAMAVSGAFTTPVVDADPDGPVPWLATVYVPGPSLQNQIERHGPMPEAQVRMLGAKLAEALIAIHRAGVIHRDLKPANILLADDGPRVIDFGISRAADGTSITATGGVIGSSGYMSPEQIAGHELTSASDVFALGAVLTFAATGRPAFGTGPFQAVMFRAAYERPQLDGVPPGLVGLVAACLEKDPMRRPPVARLPELFLPHGGQIPHATAVLPQYPDATAVLTESAEPTRAPALPRRRLLIGGGAAALVTVVGGSAALYAATRKAPPTKPPVKSTAARPSWTRPLSGENIGIAAAGDLLLVLQGRGMEALAQQDGRPRWESESSFPGFFPEATGEQIFMICDNDAIAAFDTQTGDEQWRSGLSGDPKWTFLAGSTLVVRDSSDHFHGLDTATGNLRWSHASGKVPHFPEGQAAKNIVLAVPKSYDTGYAALSLAGGEHLWTSGDPLLAHCTDGKRFYLLDPGMNLVAVDPRTGRKIWSRPSRMPPYSARTSEPTYELVLTGDTLICRCDKPLRFAAYDVATGRPRWPAKSVSDTVWARWEQTFCYLDTTLKACDLRSGKELWSVDVGGETPRFLGGAEGLLVGWTPEELRGWDLTSGKLTWTFPHPTGDAYEWDLLRTPGRLFAKTKREVFAFGLPGSKAPTIN